MLTFNNYVFHFLDTGSGKWRPTAVVVRALNYGLARLLFLEMVRKHDTTMSWHLYYDELGYAVTY